jgi:hypothetical protein
MAEETVDKKTAFQIETIGSASSAVSLSSGRRLWAQSRHCGRRPTTSGLPLQTDIVRAGRHVSNVPRSGHSRAAALEPVIPGRPAKRRRTRNPSLRVRRLRGAASPKTAPLFVATVRSPEATEQNGHRSFIDLAPPTVGQQSVRATVRPACGPSTRRREPLSRASPSGTRSRSGGAPLPRPAPWRAA